jgi:hypothetical protein
MAARGVCPSRKAQISRRQEHSHAQDCIGDCLSGRANCAGIRPCRERPDAYIRVIASLLPKQRACGSPSSNIQPLSIIREGKAGPLS